MNYDLVGPSQLVVVQLAVSALEIRTEPLWMVVHMYTCTISIRLTGNMIR